MRTRYGFIHRRDRMLAPAAVAFIAEVREVEARLAADEQRLQEVLESSRTRPVEQSR